MNAHPIHARTRGQSIPIIALMIVVLFAMVGLAVDVGNTYAEQRNTVRSSNAAALAGMNMLIRGGTDTEVYTTIVNSLKSNNIRVAAPFQQPQPGERTLNASYLDASGDPMKGCPTVGSCGSMTPEGATYIQVNVGGLVDTYFARVVGRPTLPVGANAFASRGPCASGVYPITISETYLDGDKGFKNPDSYYNDAFYKAKTRQKVTMHDPLNPSGGFDWVRWKAGTQNGNQTELAAMLTGDGNLDEGFNEADWPSSKSVNLPEPAGYPIKPNQLSQGDWMRGNSGVSASSDVKAQLNWHIDHGTVMLLPLHDTDDGGGTHGNYHFTRLGAFLLKGYSLTGHGYFDLVYLGLANDCAKPVGNPPKTTNVGVTGQVFYQPRDKMTPQSRPPVEYDIILDVSGSMSWNFAGQTGSSSNPTQCTGVPWTDACYNGWTPTSQRRIYVAKQALKGFIDNMGPKDLMRIVAFSRDLTESKNYGLENAIRELTKAWPASGPNNKNGWSSDKAELRRAVDDAGAVGDPYLTFGTTPSATGITAADRALAAAPTKTDDGQTYKRVAIFLTDGVANVLPDGSMLDFTGTNCAPDIATCNAGYIPNTNPRVAKPITAMADAAAQLKPKATIYVIALAGVDATGLRDVASAPSYPFYSEARKGADLAGIFANIATNVKEGTCVPTGGSGWASTISPENAADIPPPSGPLTYPTVGSVYLYTANGNPVPNGVAPIVVDAQSGRLTYHYTDLTPGTYIVKAGVGYKGSDNISRWYGLIFDIETRKAEEQTIIKIDPRSGLGNSIALRPLYLDMAGSVCAAQ